MVAAEVSPRWRAMAMGVTQNVGSSLLGSTVAPLVLVPIALAWGWRHAFFVAAVPGLISALLIVLFVIERPIQQAAVRQSRQRAPILETLTNRNVLTCTLMAILLVSYLVVTWAFMPLVLVQYRGIADNTAAGLMAVLGISSCIASFVVTGASDVIGRKPVMTVMPFVGMVLPLAALYYDGPALLLGAIFFAGWMFNGIFPMFMATVPAESVDPRHVATAMGIVMGVGEILGGVLAPSLAGLLSDRYGLAAPLWLLVALAAMGGIVAMFLTETAPRLRRKNELGELA
jgi:predicted MFS family arabinose efflux permease